MMMAFVVVRLLFNVLLVALRGHHIVALLSEERGGWGSWRCGTANTGQDQPPHGVTDWSRMVACACLECTLAWQPFVWEPVCVACVCTAHARRDAR